MPPSTGMVGSAVNGGHDADFREIARTKPKRERHRTLNFRGCYRRSLAETRGRNLDPGCRSEQSGLLFLLLGRRKSASVARPCAGSMCRLLFGDRIIANVQRYPAFPAPAQVRRLVQCRDGRGAAHPSRSLGSRHTRTRYLDAVLPASSLSNSAVKTCFAFPTCGTALAWSTLPGFPTTINATMPMP